MRQFADMFKYRCNPPPARTTQVEVRLLCSDATVKTLTVHIPETTPATFGARNADTIKHPRRIGGPHRCP